jgi:hypothetical protein
VTLSPPTLHKNLPVTAALEFGDDAEVVVYPCDGPSWEEDSGGRSWDWRWHPTVCLPS